ncbi:hypothetical protein LCGC14_2000710 [marine sediment metagenome]|uniref:Uncharacterized protein n=1 Tax=marine sediment metagenome TaxID=412755 RepID=A0A0F9I0F2_9ZZZZ
MPSTGIGVYLGSASVSEGDEISSTYLGRHLTFLASDITGQADALVTKGKPVVVGEHIVGIALDTEVVGGDLIPVDTEGIWGVEVVATDEDGNVAVVAGDELFIHLTTGVVSKNYNKSTHTHFGYALGGIAAGSTFVIAVKLHWDPDDECELVGQSGAESVNTRAGHRFREYHYEAQGGGYIHGDHLELTISTVSCPSAQALVRKLKWTADDNWITGYAAVGEFEIEVVGGAGTMDTICAIHLTSNIGVLSATGHNNYVNSWIYCQEYSADNEMINDMFSIVDTDADYPFTTDGNALFTTLAGDVAATHALRFIVNGTQYWMLCRNAIT